MAGAASARALLHAPNVHGGGGLVLLRAVLQAGDRPFDRAFLDERCRALVSSPDGLAITYVAPSFVARLLAEWRLRRQCRAGDLVLCLHGLPPLFPVAGRVVVFVQNRLLIERGSLAEYPLWDRTRIRLERLWSRALQGRCARYVVQTPSMAACLKRWLRRDVPVSVLPFAPPELPVATDVEPAAGSGFDFVYVASGEAHKNHRHLLAAWRLLGEAGLRPSLALTLDPAKSPALCAEVARLAGEHGVAVTNLGRVPHDAVDALYRGARAMIYPSTSESLGLPLIEASRHGLPILAPERDYVRDVVVPAETFDPDSPVSIARAVRRFLGAAEPPVRIGTAAEFLAEVLR